MNSSDDDDYVDDNDDDNGDDEGWMKEPNTGAGREGMNAAYGNGAGLLLKQQQRKWQRQRHIQRPDLK